ncbi:Uncharacterised protein [Moraxella caviae]|uniref:Uncharacterized protein n=1 Tax=Moraxella caviae TaxID=34060 RepID=A0A378RA84_9GAMM|nr:Uncharacterised protein [Moraxella caviae]VEW13341.1 Uncharacterised protein [Moraxella caviae]
MLPSQLKHAGIQIEQLEEVAKCELQHNNDLQLIRFKKSQTMKSPIST